MARRALPVVVYSLVVWIAAVFDGSIVAPYHFRAHPNGPLLVAICGAWTLGGWEGAWLGFWAGALMASLTGMFVGSFTFSYLVTGWCVGRTREIVYNDWPLLVVPVAGFGTLVGELIFFLWSPRHAGSVLSMVRTAGLNAVVAPLVYFPLRRLRQGTMGRRP